MSLHEEGQNSIRDKVFSELSMYDLNEDFNANEKQYNKTKNFKMELHQPVKLLEGSDLEMKDRKIGIDWCWLFCCRYTF